jgi:SNF family Na+-dependent transporter
MGSGPVGDLKKDVLYSLFLSIVVLSMLFFISTPLVALENIDAINRTITTILGLLFPVLAIIYTFGFRDENEAIRELKRVGKFEDVVTIFTLSIASIGVIWIYTFSITVFQIHEIFNADIQSVFAYTAIFAFVFVIFRLWRCFQIFFLLNRAIRTNE